MLVGTDPLDQRTKESLSKRRGARRVEGLSIGIAAAPMHVISLRRTFYECVEDKTLRALLRDISSF